MRGWIRKPNRAPVNRTRTLRFEYLNMLKLLANQDLSKEYLEEFQVKVKNDFLYTYLKHVPIKRA